MQLGSDSDHEYPPNSEDSESDEDAKDSQDDSAQESEGSDVDSSDDEPDNGEAKDPIYPGAPISLRESLVAIFSLMSVEHLSGTLVVRILRGHTNEKTEVLKKKILYLTLDG